MRLLELNPFYLPYNGGIEKRIAAFSKRFSGRHEVYVLTSRLPGTSGEEKLHGATVIRLPSRFYGNYNPPIVSSSGVAEYISSLDPDVIDYHYRWSHSYNSAFFASRKPRVMTFHNLYGEGAGAMKVLSMINDFHFVRRLRAADCILPVSDFVRRQLIEKGIRPERLVTSYNGIDVHDCRTTDERFALFIGRLVPTKGIQYLVRAAKSAGIPLKVAGSGPMLDRLKRIEEKGKLEVLGAVDEDTKERLLSSCTLLALPSLQEAFGVAALEAMAHSKPVVASDSGGLPEVVGGGGTIVKMKSVEGLAAAMKSFWMDDSLAAEKGLEGRKRAAAFSWDASADRVESVYKSVLATSG